MAESPDVTLESFRPADDYDVEASRAVIETFESLPAEAVVHVWGGDWCGDCRAQLPVLAATLAAAGVPDDRIAIHPVDEDKRGPRTDAYGITHVPTVVVERDGDELARYVESADAPIDVALAARLSQIPAGRD